jgi:ABC-type multidrug transport system fused ATPase/permease subunit
VISACLFIILGQSLYISLPFVVGKLIDRLSNQNDLMFWLILFPTIWTISVIFSSFAKFYFSILTQRVRNISKAFIFRDLLQQQPYLFYLSRDSGEIEHLMQELSFNSRFIFNESLPFFLRTTITFFAALLMLSVNSIELALIFLIWCFLYLPLSYLNAKNSIIHVSNSLLKAAKVSASTVEVIQNYELIPAFGTQEFEISRFRGSLEEEELAFNKAQKRIDIFDLWQRVLQVILPLAFVNFIYFSGKYSALTPGTVASLLSLSLILTGQLGELGKGILSFFEMRERMKTAIHKLASPQSFEVPKKQKQNRSTPNSWTIQLENVTFSYENHPTIEIQNLLIQEKEKVGIIGYSGAGKTTLIRLLRGYLTPSKGFIKIGEDLLNNIDQEYLAQNIAEVSQNIPLFNRTIKENIVYGLNHVSDEEIWEILKKAYLSDFVAKLPKKLDTVVGVRGQKLSGGERARVGIARAFIRNAKIIILDEAMASLDSESELLIQKGLDDLCEGRTLIAIAHRLSTLRAMDKIIVMEKGNIIAQGTHAILFEDCDLYKKLWNAQVLV